VIAHQAVPARFARYKITRGYNSCINARQFKMQVEWPATFREPDETYADERMLDAGGVRIELRHARGETDDHTWAWLPAQRVLCTGDLFIWACPNAGNPQKVQRYPREWAAALREMATRDAEVLCPGHGPPIMGAARVRQALEDTAALLEHLVARTLEAMNAGARLDDILHSVRAPAHLLERPYLRPIYDDPEFIVRNIWRLYGGWWDGDPAHLKPAPAAQLAREVAALSGGAAALGARAEALLARGEVALACQLAEWAAAAAPGDATLARIRQLAYEERATREPSLMAKGIFSDAAKRPPRG
jgi:alkyl sulfatase BDS1-like metallo-beta-lactamase superfamily hydrolase